MTGAGCASAGRSTSTSRARRRSPSPARTARWRSTPRPSTRPRSSRWSPALALWSRTRSRVPVRRMGGGFGGKETQGNRFAAVAALAAPQYGRAVAVRSGPRRRHDRSPASGTTSVDRLRRRLRRRRRASSPLDVTHRARCGWSTDLSLARCRPGDAPRRQRLLPRHADHLAPSARPIRRRNTAFRGFGGPQGMVGDRRTIDRGTSRARWASTRSRCGGATSTRAAERNVTPYGQDRRAQPSSSRRSTADARDAVIATTSRRARRTIAPPATRDRSHRSAKGLALTPVKFGISLHRSPTSTRRARWCTSTRRLASHLNHGGTEMGQGLNTKVAQVVGRGVPASTSTGCGSRATDTDKVPNTSATAASSGTDLNGMAAQNAADADPRPDGRICGRRGSTSTTPVRVVPGHGMVDDGGSAVDRR